MFFFAYYLHVGYGVCSSSFIFCLGSVLLNDTYITSVFDGISAFYRNLRRLNLHEYEPQLARKTIVHPTQNRHYNSNGRGRHPRGCPAGVGLSRRHVRVGALESQIHHQLVALQRSTCQKSQLLLPSASSFCRPPRCGHFVKSTT